MPMFVQDFLFQNLQIGSKQGSFYALIEFVQEWEEGLSCPYNEYCKTLSFQKVEIF